MCAMGHVCPEIPLSFFLYDLAAEEPSEPAGVIISRRYHGQQKMILKVDEEFRIILDGAGGEGYRWCLDHYDRRSVALVSERTFAVDPPAAAEHSGCGPSVRSVWHFKALKSGETRISFWYYRFREGHSQSVRHYLLTLDITK